MAIAALRHAFVAILSVILLLKAIDIVVHHHLLMLSCCQLLLVHLWATLVSSRILLSHLLLLYGTMNET